MYALTKKLFRNFSKSHYIFPNIQNKFDKFYRIDRFNLKYFCTNKDVNKEKNQISENVSINKEEENEPKGIWAKIKRYGKFKVKSCYIILGKSRKGNLI